MKLDNSLAAVVTGGGSGLGEATARALAAKGVRVCVFDVNETNGNKIATEIGGVFAKVDVSNTSSVADGLNLARQAHGQERICVNCAGIAIAEKTVSKGEVHNADHYAKVIGVNLIGTFNVASQAAGGMTVSDPINDDGERGIIINTASVAAYDGQVGQIAYGASKAGVAGMTLPMARDLSRDGVRVLTIAPGLFGTPMLLGMPDEVQAALAAQVPFPSRLGLPEEYANLAVHMCENAMLNGEVVRLDGAIRMAPR